VAATRDTRLGRNLRPLFVQPVTRLASDNECSSALNGTNRRAELFAGVDALATP
jgi:hypothetical protein